MTISPRILLAATALLICAQSPALARTRIVNKDTQLVRLSQNRDGTYTEFKRNPSNTTLEKRTFGEKPNGEKILISRTLYRRDKHGNLRSGQVLDGQGKKLFRIVYGYHRNSGRLIAENMYDARVKRTKPGNPNEEEPVRATRWHYDAQGKQSAPIVFTSQAGASSESLMKWLDVNTPGSDVEKDPYRRVPVNPNARPLGSKR